MIKEELLFRFVFCLKMSTFIGEQVQGSNTASGAGDLHSTSSTQPTAGTTKTIRYQINETRFSITIPINATVFDFVKAWKYRHLRLRNDDMTDICISRNDVKLTKYSVIIEENVIVNDVDPGIYIINYPQPTQPQQGKSFYS